MKSCFTVKLQDETNLNHFLPWSSPGASTVLISYVEIGWRSSASNIVKCVHNDDIRTHFKLYKIDTIFSIFFSWFHMKFKERIRPFDVVVDNLINIWLRSILRQFSCISLGFLNSISGPCILSSANWLPMCKKKVLFLSTDHFKAKRISYTFV